MDLAWLSQRDWNQVFYTYVKEETVFKNFEQNGAKIEYFENIWPMIDNYFVIKSFKKASFG